MMLHYIEPARRPKVWIEILFGGVAAEQIRRGRGRHRLPWNSHSARGDLKKARRVVGDCDYGCLYRATVKLLCNRWDGVKKIAAALLEHGSITDGMVEELLSPPLTGACLRYSALMRSSPTSRAAVMHTKRCRGCSIAFLTYLRERAARGEAA